MKEEGPTIWGQFLDTALKKIVLVVIAHPTVANLLSAVLECLFKLGLCKYSDILPIGAYPFPVIGCQDLIGLLYPKGFPSLGSPHELGVAVLGVLVHENSVFP